MKRLLVLVAAVVLLLTPISASMAQTAADMRLEAHTGTVYVTDAAGSQLSVQDGMRLFDGYGMNTGTQSYAWVSLDKTKALKLDALSSVEINKTGRKLKINLFSGKLLCDVFAPLDDSESLEIRTSTTVTGIRGTVLVVKVIDVHTTVIYVLEGKVTVTETNPETGNTRMITVAAGQLATSTARSASSGGEGNDVILRSFTAEEVDDFVLDEIDTNPAFVEHLRTTDAAEVLKLLDQTEPAGTGETSGEDVAPTYVDVMITDSSNPKTEFLNALADNAYLNLTASNIADLRPGEDVDVAVTQTIQLVGTNMDMEGNDLNNAGTINVDEDSNLECDGTLTNSSSNTLNIYGSLIMDGTLVNTGVINIYGRGGLVRVWNLINQGILNIFENGTLEIHEIGGGGDNAIELGRMDNSGEINVSGTLDIGMTSDASNQGEITISQTGELLINPAVPFTNQSEGVIINQGSINIKDRLINNGDIQNTGTIDNAGFVDNAGTIDNTGTIIIYEGIINDGTIDNDGTITNNGEVENNGTIDNAGTIENNYTIVNDGTIINDGTITNNGDIRGVDGITGNAVEDGES